ncbi:MAG: hypothetical protein ACKVWR_16860 [Acidimicrobiales bacterium]
MIISDMQGNNEARYHGVPDGWSWALTPDLSADANEARNYRAITGYGIVYETAEGNPATNTRVHLRDMQTWVLSRSTGTWRQVQRSTDVEGDAFLETFAGNNSVAADVRREPDGGVSVTAGGGRNFHFWPSTGRGAIDPGDLAGMWITFKARLVTADANRPDDRASARYVAAAGADYWEDVQSGSNRGIGQGKGKLVTSEWRDFNFHSLTAEQMRANPPG